MAIRISKILQKPIITEKGVRLGVNNEYVFKVSLNATKNAIAENVKKVFGVDVVGVKTMIVPGKRKRVLKTRTFIRTPKWKKAVVRLKEGQVIKLFPESEENK